MSELVVALLLALVLGCIPGAVASSKGHSFLPWWLFGAALFIVALPLSILLEPRRRVDSGEVAAADLAFIESGKRFIFGYTASPSAAYCVWDRLQPGPPVFKAPYSQRGNYEAAARFHALERSLTASLRIPERPDTHQPPDSQF
jgi:hypothetical protein